MSKIEQLILDKNFKYEEPYFYKNNLAMRCELGIGKGRKYMINAKERASEIFSILFKNGVDIFFFDNCYFDYDTYDEVYVKNYISMIKNEIKFVVNYKNKFKHTVVSDIVFEREEYENDIIKKNRICFYPDATFKPLNVINSQIKGDETFLIHFVSFENQCIFTVYDDRGCDVVFYDKAKFKAFYPQLEKYFLDYDRELIKQRYTGS